MYQALRWFGKDVFGYSNNNLQPNFGETDDMFQFTDTDVI